MTTTNDTRSIVKSMWSEAGVQFRSNLLQLGQSVALHAHDYAHVMLVTEGIVRVREQGPDGSIEEFEMAGKGEAAPESRGYRLTMPAFHAHAITCMKGPAEVLCLWAATSDDGHAGC